MNTTPEPTTETVLPPVIADAPQHRGSADFLLRVAPELGECFSRRELAEHFGTLVHRLQLVGRWQKLNERAQ